MEIREATKSDAEATCALALASWAQFENELSPAHWTTLQRTLSNVDFFLSLIKNSYGVVYTDDFQKVVGMSFLVHSGNPTEIYPDDWSYIRFLTVHPDFYGQGTGRTLMRFCIDRARLKGEHTVGLHTSEFMNVARGLYERMGFYVAKDLGLRLGRQYWLYKYDLT